MTESDERKSRNTHGNGGRGEGKNAHRLEKLGLARMMLMAVWRVETADK